MIEDVISVSVIAIVSSILSLMLKKDRPEFSVMIGISAGIIILTVILPAAHSATNMLLKVSGAAGVDGEYMTIIIKSCVVAMISSVCASTCRDAGNSSLALKLEIVGRIAILIIALPVINKLFDIILSVIK